MHSSKVISCANYDMGNIIGVNNYNPMFDMCMYDVMFPYGYLQRYEANFIAENM